MRFAFALVLLAFSAVCAAPPDTPVTAGADGVTVIPRPEQGKAITIKAPKGKLTKLSAGMAKTARWLLIDSNGADLDNSIDPSGVLAIFTATTDGTYRVVLAVDGDLVLIVVTVGDAPMPKPPVPVPPDSPLRKKIKAAFDIDANNAKHEHAKDLAALYREAAKLSMKDEVATSGELLRRVKEAGNAIVPDGLIGVRKIAAEELVMIFGSDADLTPEQRKAAAELFGQLATILDSF
jgi:hypothetical protein